MNKIKDTKVYNILDFLNWYKQNELDLKPRYQRNPVWDYRTQSYLIDTILRGLPIPQIFIRQIIDTRTMKSKREVVDGQQRLRAILGFIKGEFKVMKSHNNEYQNMKFDDLTEQDKERFLYYQIPTEVININDESIIYDMFARLNTNGISLNKQEVRNALYRGEFKVFAYNITSRWRDMFLKLQTFTEKNCARMNDVEFMSSIIIMTINGIVTDSQTNFNNIYKEYDEKFENVSEVEYKINSIFACIASIFEEYDYDMLHSKNYMYTIYGFLLGQMFDIANLEIIKYEKYSLEEVNDNIVELSIKLAKIDEYLVQVKEKEYDSIPNTIKKAKIIELYQHHITHTTSMSERRERIQILNHLVGIL